MRRTDNARRLKIVRNIGRLKTRIEYFKEMIDDDQEELDRLLLVLETYNKYGHE